GGIGTSSRKVQTMDFTVGVLVQANFGSRRFLRIAGVPVGKEIRDNLVFSKDTGSIIIVAATDAPLLPHQLKRIARRLSLGLARTGTISGNGSGDIFIAFSIANREANQVKEIANLQMLPNNKIDRVFQATVEATEEAIINALIAAGTMTGIDDHKVIALPHDRLREILKKYNRVNESN
ncbi:P1 family peptidase, partial [bacterium]|nr:P1 family peptidase [bacterium]